MIFFDVHTFIDRIHLHCLTFHFILLKQSRHCRSDSTKRATFLIIWRQDILIFGTKLTFWEFYFFKLYFLSLKWIEVVYHHLEKMRF